MVSKALFWRMILSEKAATFRDHALVPANASPNHDQQASILVPQAAGENVAISSLTVRDTLPQPVAQVAAVSVGSPGRESISDPVAPPAAMISILLPRCEPISQPVAQTAAVISLVATRC
jgi:hypothetical protein